MSGKADLFSHKKRHDSLVATLPASGDNDMGKTDPEETRNGNNSIHESSASATSVVSKNDHPETNEQREPPPSDAEVVQNQDGKNGKNTRRPKITLSKLLKFTPTSVSNNRKITPSESLPEKAVDSEETLENDVDEAKQIDYGLHKPNTGWDDKARDVSRQRKASTDKVTFHIGSDTESDNEYATSKKNPNGKVSRPEKEERQSGKTFPDELNDSYPCQNDENDKPTTTTRNGNSSSNSLASGMSTSSMSLPSPTREGREICDNSSEEDNDKSVIINNNNNQNDGISEEEHSEHLTKEDDNIDEDRTNTMADDSYNSNNNSINSNGSSKAANNLVQGILRKSFDRDQTTAMSGGLRRYRRRSQMSITSEIPADVPPKQRRAECENRMRDNLDYFRRRVSVQEDNNVVIDANGDKPVVRSCFSIEDDGRRGDDGVPVGYVTSPQYHYNHQGFKCSSSIGSISPMSLSPTSSTVFDYGTSANGRRSANGSMSSVRWEDIVLAENNLINKSSSRSSNNNNNGVEKQQIMLQQIGQRNVGKSHGSSNGFSNKGYQTNDSDLNGDADGENGKIKNKRRQGSVVLPLNVADLVQQNDVVHDNGHYGLKRVLNDGRDGDNGVDEAVVVEDNVDDENDDDPPPYVPMKRRQVERTRRAAADCTSFRDRNLPNDFRRHSSASVDSTLSTGSAGSSASILKHDSLAIFNRRSSGSKRRLSQISLTDLGNIGRKHMEMSKKEWLSTYSLHIFVLFIFLITVLSVSLAWYYRNLSIKMLQQTQRVFFDPRTRKLSLTDPTDQLTIEGYLGLDMPRWQLPLHCPLVVGQDPSKRSCEWKNNAVLTIDHFGNDRVQCYNVTWKSQHPWHVPYDCFHLKGGEWYGPSNNSKGTWPINGNFSFSPSNQRPRNNGVFGSVVDYFWVSSAGVGLQIHGDDPVHIKWNQTKDNQFCILSNYTGSLYDQTSPPMLKYTICNGQDTVQTHSFMHESFPPKYDITFPPDYVFSGYYWSARGILGRSHNITQDDIVRLTLDARNFTSKRTSSSSSSTIYNDIKISLDTHWQKEEGDLTFDLEMFPNMTEMSETIKQTGSQIILSMSPHVFFTSSNFQKGIISHLFVNDASGTVTGLVEFGKGVASVIDVMKEDGKVWLEKKLKALMIPNVTTSLRLAFGNHPWLPFKPHFGVPSATPDAYMQKIGEIISEFSEAPIMEHTGNTRHLTQLIPVSSEIGIHKSSGRKCVQGIIERALTLGVMGYPFVMADGLKDNTLEMDNVDYPVIPNRELYMRWIQIATFFPATQLSTAPWQYDAEVVALATNYSILHETHVMPILRTPSLRKEVVDNGMPLLRPVWWADPSDQDLEKFKVDDEFTVGDNLLVAPVLCEGVRQRHVYIPSGVWEDIHLIRVIIGPKILEDYPVPLHQIAVFKRRETVM